MKAAVSSLIRNVRLNDSEAINEMRRQEDVRANRLALAPELRHPNCDSGSQEIGDFLGVAM